MSPPGLPTGESLGAQHEGMPVIAHCPKLLCVVPVDPPAAGGGPPLRLAHLFRDSLRAGRLHPLLCLVAEYRAQRFPMSTLALHRPTGMPPPCRPLTPGAVRARVRELPSMPQVLGDLLRAIGQDDVPIERLADKLAHDQALTAKVLRLANSSFYGVQGRVGTPRDAIHILGVRTLATVVSAAAARASFAPPLCAGFDFARFWRHAIGSALAAQALADALNLDADIAFIAGLLHDIGRLALASHFPQDYAQALAWRAALDLPLAQAEQAVLAIDHADVGAQIAAHWHFAPATVAAIHDHHRPPAAGSTAPTLADLVHLADQIAHALDLAGQPDAMVPPLDLAAWARLGLDEAQCLALFRRTESQMQGLCDALADTGDDAP